MQQNIISTETPRPGLKKSMNLRFPGFTTSVLVPDPTGVRKGLDNPPLAWELGIAHKTRSIMSRQAQLMIDAIRSVYISGKDG